jgi:hypothetical protein
MNEFMHEHPYLTFFLGLAAVHGLVTIVRGREPPLDLGPLLGPQPPHPFSPMHAAPPQPLHPAVSRSPYPTHLTGAPGGDYSFTRRPGFNGKDY